ncbi:cell division protein FtsZ, partial [Streptomyces sp. NPDC057654]
VLGSTYGNREESAPAPAPSRPAEPARPSFGGLGSVTAPRDEEPAPAETSPVSEVPPPPISTPQVPPARPYQDSTAEELDVPDFLK